MREQMSESSSSSDENSENSNNEGVVASQEADLSLVDPEIQELSPEDIAHEALTRLFEDYSNFSTMSEDVAAIQKRVLFNEDTPEIAADDIYPKSPTPKSPRMPKTTHFPSSSTGQGSSKFRHKSPTNRHISPHRSISKNKIIYNWENVKSVRKTQSTALPTLINSPWARSTTASTPELKVEQDQNVGTDSNRDGNSYWQRNRQTSCHYNLRLIFIILNCVILAAGLIHFAAAAFLTIYKETVLIIVEYRIYVLCVILLYIDAIILLFLSLTGLCVVHHRRSRKRHVACLLLMAAFTISLGILQSNVQTNIQVNARQRMMSSIALRPEVVQTNTRVIWDYFHETFKCCGVDGHLDWCEKIHLHGNIAHSTNFLGSYTCHLPVSCCIENIDEIISLEKNTQHLRKVNIRCATSPTPWNTRRGGCLGHVKREIHYGGKLFRVISFGTGIILSLASAIDATLFFYV